MQCDRDITRASSLKPSTIFCEGPRNVSAHGEKGNAIVTSAPALLETIAADFRRPLAGTFKAALDLADHKLCTTGETPFTAEAPELGEFWALG